MANSISPNQSSPFSGLGTASLQVTAAGLYTMSFKSFLPYLASGSAPQSAAPVSEVQTVTTVADVSGSLNSTYFTFFTAGNTKEYYVWFNINSAGVDPAVAGATGIAVAGATGVSANNLAAAARTAIAAAAPEVVVTGATNNIILSSVYPGSMTAAANGTASPGFSYAVGTTGTFGTPAISGLAVALKQNSTILAIYGYPSPTQPLMGGSVQVAASASDTLSFVFSSLSSADSALNAVKSIVNIYLGE